MQIIYNGAMNIFIYTLGCRVNQCESESAGQAFEKAGHNILKTSEGADLIIVNTCTVTSKAEQKARRMIRIFAKQALTLVTGCYAQVNSPEIKALSDNVEVLPLSRKAELLLLPVFLESHSGLSLREAVSAFCEGKQNLRTTVFDYAATGFNYHCRSYLKVQDGCDNNCGYCLVHIARGPSSFLDSDTVVSRALEIERNGYHEIVLTGVNLTMYDHEGRGLGGLLEKLLSALGPDMRIRLSSLEPDHIDDLLIRQLEDRRMQPYFHIPIQSASDRVIRRVNRHYDSGHLEDVMTKIRAIRPDAFFACDIITGLPGEEDEDFEITKAFLEKHRFSSMHVFPFSPRPNTALYDARDKVPQSVRDERARILRELSDSQRRQYISSQIGRENEVIVEEKSRGIWYGLTGNYIRVSLEGVPAGTKCGDLLKVVLTDQDKARVI